MAALSGALPQDYTGLGLERLRDRRLSGGEYLQFVEKAEADVQAARGGAASARAGGCTTAHRGRRSPQPPPQAYVATAARYTNAGGGCFCHITVRAAAERIPFTRPARAFVRRFRTGGLTARHTAQFSLAEMSAARSGFLRTGELTLDIALPPESSYYRVVRRRPKTAFHQ